MPGGVDILDGVIRAIGVEVQAQGVRAASAVAVLLSKAATSASQADAREAITYYLVQHAFTLQ